MQYGNVYVDERYSSIVEPNLYGDAIMQPGKTFNSEYQGDASCGLVKIYKQTRDSSGDPTTPAGDFTHENTANTLIDLRLGNAFRKSKKIYQIAAGAVPYSLAETTLSTAVADNQEDWQHSALACLVHEGTAVTRPSSAVKAENLKALCLSLRKQLRKRHAKPDVAIASVDLYSTMLEVAGKEYTPSTNDNTMTTGRVGTWLGMTWYEGDLLDKAAAKYYDHANTLQTVNLSEVALIMYDHRAMHIVDNLSVQRIVDAVDFVGSYAQNEINSGFRVSNADCVAVLKVSADTTLDSLEIGSLTLSPAFDPATITYTAATTNATNTIRAVATDNNATIEIKNGETVVANGAAATWASGDNTLTVKVTVGSTSKTYTVTVTKS